MRKRCAWPGEDEKMIKYHDEYWGKPNHDDKDLFAKLMLDAFQAGLSWRTILYKQENFEKAFDNFIPEVIAKYGEDKVQELMQDAGIVRNQAKIRATIHNANLVLDNFPKKGEFSNYLWSFVNGETIVNNIKSEGDFRATSPESDLMSIELKKLGFKFVGSTVCYAFMEAVGMINDHEISCFRFKEVVEQK